MSEKIKCYRKLVAQRCREAFKTEMRCWAKNYVTIAVSAAH